MPTFVSYKLTTVVFIRKKKLGCIISCQYRYIFYFTYLLNSLFFVNLALSVIPNKKHITKAIVSLDSMQCGVKRFYETDAKFTNRLCYVCLFFAYSISVCIHRDTPFYFHLKPISISFLRLFYFQVSNPL